jgi:hypothetical protein
MRLIFCHRCKEVIDTGSASDGSFAERSLLLMLLIPERQFLNSKQSTFQTPKFRDEF